MVGGMASESCIKAEVSISSVLSSGSMFRASHLRHLETVKGWPRYFRQFYKCNVRVNQ